jgi:hypothetical protein
MDWRYGPGRQGGVNDGTKISVIIVIIPGLSSKQRGPGDSLSAGSLLELARPPESLRLSSLRLCQPAWGPLQSGKGPSWGHLGPQGPALGPRMRLVCQKKESELGHPHPGGYEVHSGRDGLRPSVAPAGQRPLQRTLCGLGQAGTWGKRPDPAFQELLPVEEAWQEEPLGAGWQQ